MELHMYMCICSSVVHKFCNNGTSPTRKKLTRASMPRQVSIAVVGAGVAGLSTAVHLIKAGFTNVTVLEASDRIGGRVRSVSPREGEGIVELGATCIHGATSENPVYALTKEWGLIDSGAVLIRTEGQYRQENGQEIDHRLVEEVWHHFEDLLSSLEKIYHERDTTKEAGNRKSVAEFVAEARPEFLEKFAAGEKREAASQLLNTMLNYIRFFNGDELHLLSADLFGCYKTIPGDEIKSPGGRYLSFVERLYDQIPKEKVILNKEVVKIIWSEQTDGEKAAGDGKTEEQIRIQCRDGEIFNFDHVVVTCSLGYLKANFKQLFHPPLPETKAGAIERMGFGHVEKLFVYYDKPFWTDGFKLAWTDDLSEIKEESDWIKRFVAFDVQHTNARTLGGPFGGRGAEIMGKLSDDEIALTCRDIFRKFLNDSSIPAPDLVLRSSWIRDPLYLGAYSFLGVDSRDTDTEDLASPLPSRQCPKLLFAGEATHPEYFSTLHGAFLTGVRESRRIQEIYQ